MPPDDPGHGSVLEDISTAARAGLDVTNPDAVPSL